MTFVTDQEPRPDDDAQAQQSRPEQPSRSKTPTPPSMPSVRRVPTPPPQARQPRRGGCLLPAVLIGLVAVLVVIGLLLPPLALLDRLNSPQYVMLDVNTPGVSHPDGLTLTIDTRQPGEGFGVVLCTIDAAAFTDGTADTACNAPSVRGDWAASARGMLPPALRLLSPLYTIIYEGTPPGAIGLQVTMPPNAEPYDTLDLYAWNEDSSQWEFVPSQQAEGNTALVTDLSYVPGHLAVFQTSAPAAVVTVPLDVTQALTPDIAGLAHIVMPAGLQPTIQGTLQGSLAANFQTHAGYAVLLTVRNWSDPNALDVSTVETTLSNEALLAEHIRQLSDCAQSCYQSTAVDGIAVDYQGITSTYRDQFSLFVRELARSLHTNGQSLAVVVPAAQEGAVGQPWDTGAYDWRAIGRYADIVLVNLGNNPVDFIPGGLVERMLRWGVGEVSRYKLQISLSALSYRQVGVDAPSYVPISFAEAVSGLGNVAITTTSDLHYFLPGTTIEATLNGYPATTGFDEAAQTPYIEYQDGGERIWLTTRAALLYRMNRTLPFHIGGVAVRDLLSPIVSPETIQAVADYTLNTGQPAGTGVELSLRWTVLSSSGAVIGENTTGIGEPFRWEAVGQDGNYAINVAVASGGQESARGGQQVAVALPTSTPLPTATPTPTPTPVPPTPVPQAPAQQQPAQQQPAQQQPAQQQSAPPAQVSGHVGGSFEIGGHVADFNTAIPYLQAAGMRWVKVQVRYGYGSDPGGQAGIINAVHGAGLKILLGVVGYPNELGSIAEGEYYAAFANYCAGLARLGADAIEVWNEMNIDREWPTGRIDPAAYARMLQAAYNAIRGANGSTMVISGALSPTGAEGYFGTDRVWNDDHYYAGMAAAGVANYADCIGAHYNEGIVPPDQVGGDPRGGYPSYFLTTMTDRAWGPFGGSRPVCYTELGYLSPEGYGPPPAGFEWGGNTTVAQQAAWLAQAAVINSSSGKVRLMIIWNVNFTNYEGDPMAGYAIVRPGGGCPACDTLHSVTG